MRKPLLAVAILVLALPAFAVENPARPGKWQIKMQMEMPGMPMKLPPVSMEVCLTPEDVADPQKAVPNDPKSDCKVGDYKVSGKTVSWTIECPKSKMKGSGEITYTDDAYSGVMKMKVEDQEMTTKYTGKWLGACTKK